MSYFDTIQELTRNSLKELEKLKHVTYENIFKTYDEKYIEEIKQIIENAAKHGIFDCYVTLDVGHRDAYIKHLETIFEKFIFRRSLRDNIYISWK